MWRHPDFSRKFERAAWALGILFISLATTHVIRWNDCSAYAVVIGEPTTYTLEDGCWVIDGELTTLEPGYRMGPGKHATLLGFAGLTACFSTLAAIWTVPPAAMAALRSYGNRAEGRTHDDTKAS